MVRCGVLETGAGAGLRKALGKNLFTGPIKVSMSKRLRFCRCNGVVTTCVDGPACVEPSVMMTRNRGVVVPVSTPKWIPIIDELV